MNATTKFGIPTLLFIAAMIRPMAASAQMMPPPPGMQAAAGHPGMGQPPEHGKHGPMMPGLELSEAQQDKAFALKHAGEPLHRELAKAVHKAREALHAMVKAGEFDEKKAATLSASLGQATAALELQQARSHAQFIALLTPEQRKLMAAERPHRPSH